jgi:tetratricopeptide (TPR) repeat protein
MDTSTPAIAVSTAMAEAVGTPITMATETPAEQMRRGLVELRHEHWAAALATLSALVSREPDWADAHAYLSGAQIATGQYVEAIDSVDRALALDPEGFGPNLKAGELSLRLGHQENAERQLLAAVRASAPASSDESAAKALLTLTRKRRRAGIVRGASLPGRGHWRRPALALAARLLGHATPVPDGQADTQVAAG